jgi:hypothetical protein
LSEPAIKADLNAQKNGIIEAVKDTIKERGTQATVSAVVETVAETKEGDTEFEAASVLACCMRAHGERVGATRMTLSSSLNASCTPGVSPCIAFAAGCIVSSASAMCITSSVE